jgi:hypothetical protein
VTNTNDRASECKPGGCSAIGCDGGAYCKPSSAVPDGGKGEAVESDIRMVNMGDLVEFHHPQYGGGFFATEDCFTAPQAECAPRALTDASRLSQIATVVKDLIETLMLWNGQASAGLDVKGLAGLRDELNDAIEQAVNKGAGND